MRILDESRQGIRSLQRTPGVTAAALVCPVAGIAVSTSIFSVAYGIMWRPLPLPAPEQVVTLWQRNADGSRGNVGYETFVDWRRRSSSFVAIAAVRSWLPQWISDNVGRGPRPGPEGRAGAAH